MSKNRIRAASVGLASALALVTVGAAPALAKDGDVIRRGTCSARSEWKLKLAPRDGRIETEFEVDSNRVGQTWSVRIADNGVRVFSGTATTAGPSGSFKVRKVIPDQAGTDAVVARATNPNTGETCVGRASL